uniref:Ig-like domain-containing protein n=1 Tax=Astyanax mexicanus TaxID=7994 RepID=W5LGT7_ASTMX
TERPKATVKVQPAERVFIRERVTLTCDIESGEDWRYEWFKNNNPLSEAQWRKKYEISNVDGSDEGDYSCKGRRLTEPSYSEISAAVRLTVSEISKPTLRVDPHTTVYTGETLTLTCDLKSSLTGWKFIWFRISQQLQPPEYKNTNTVNISASDTGTAEYQCSALRRENITTNHSDPVNITVQALPKPKLTSSLTGSALRGSSVTLECKLDQTTGWKFYWYKNKQKDFSTETQSYTIRSVRDSDGGQYWCRAEKGSITTPYSNAFWVQVTESPKAVVSVNPDKDVYRGETVTLRCDIQSGGDTEWKYSWFKDDQEFHLHSTSQEFRFNPVREHDSGKFTCRGERKRDSVFSEMSDALTLTVFGEAQAVLSVSPQSWLTEGDSVTLSCEVRHSSTGWRFSWYRDGQELVSDSRREAGGSYTLSPAALNHTGVYVCRATRGEPTFDTQSSNPQPLWITGPSPPVSLIIRPGRTRHFINDSLSLSCEGQNDSTGWRVRRYTHSGELLDCTSVWVSVTGYTCNISSLSTSHTGVYWCQSGSGGRSHPLNITVHSLSSSEAPFSVLSLLSCLVASSPYLLASIILGVKCYRARAKPDEVNRTKELIEEEHRTES